MKELLSFEDFKKSVMESTEIVVGDKLEEGAVTSMTTKDLESSIMRVAKNLINYHPFDLKLAKTLNDTLTERLKRKE